MSTTKKLSEMLANEFSEGPDAYHGDLAPLARALEERVAELEACNQVARHYADGLEIQLHEAQDATAAATARAEAAEAERDALRAKLEKVRAECGRLGVAEYSDASWRVLNIIDGEGDDEGGQVDE